MQSVKQIVPFIDEVDGIRPKGALDIHGRWICLGVGVRMIDTEDIPAIFLDLFIDMQLFIRINTVAKRALLGINGAVDSSHLTFGTGKNPTAFIGGLSPSVDDHTVGELPLKIKQFAGSSA